LAIALGASSMAWGQGGRRGNPAAQEPGAQQPAAQRPATQQSGAPTGAPQSVEPGATGRGAPGGRGAAAGATAPNEFYNFSTNANRSRADADVDGKPVETHQKIAAGGQSFAYTTRAGFLPVVNATTGVPEAHLFFTSYTKDGASDTAGRPLIFFFGGAPGVSAAWQDFGGLGPKRMKPEGGWGDNPNTILGHADLVFVNPVGTGFSFPVQPNHGSAFWDTTGDIASLGEFVRLYLNRNNRLESPVFVAGEDAATGRVGGLAEYLTDHMVPVRGVVLLSVAPAPDATAGDAQYITLLPSLVLSSWYHKKLSPEMNGMSAEQIAGQARQFASREYLHALYKGDRLTSDERTKVIADLARLTGLSKAFIINNDLRITFDRYNAELMRDEHRGLSRSDARVTGFQPMPSGFGFGGGGGGRFGAPPSVDFNISEISAPFAAAYESYLRRELNFTGDKEGIFYLSSGGIGTFTSTGNDETSLSAAFAHNSKLHLFVSINYYDLGAPFYATEYTLAHLNVSPEVRAHNISISHEEAGQMNYMDSKAVVKLEHDLASFVGESMSTK
jgi:carboxypeptidase C (cathepsin A)